MQTIPAPAVIAVHATTLRARLTPLAFAIHMACATLLAAGYSGSAQAEAAVAYDIPAGPLAEALNRFAQQSGVSIVVDADKVQGLRTQGLKGYIDVDEGFRQLLQGSGYQIGKTSSGYVLMIAPAAPPSNAPTTDHAATETILPEVKVSASAVQGPARSASTSTVKGVTKTALSLREVPQTVNVIGEERIQEQNLYTLEQAMKQVGGVSVQRIDSNRMTFFSRGFQITSLQLDGTPTTFDNRLFLSPDMAMYERMEVLKGPAGILNGAGSPGGSISLQRKRPQAEAAVYGELSAGSWDDYRGMIDVTGPLTESGNLRGRAVVSLRDRQLHYDKGEQEHQLFYGVLEADLTPDTLLTFGASYQEVDARAQRSLPADWTIVDGQHKLKLYDVSRSNFYGADWNRDYFWSTSIFAELEQQLANGWQAKLALRHADNNFDLTQAYARNPFGPQGDVVTLNAVAFDYREKQNEVDAYVDGPFNLFGREHKLLLGANYTKSEFSDKGNVIGDFLGTVDLNNPVSNFPQPDFTDNGDEFGDTEQRGIYSNLRLSLADPLTLVLGGRLSWWDFTNTTYTAAGVKDTSSKDKIDAEFTPYVGLIYDLNDTYSLYTSYAEVFQPHRANIRDADGKMLEPLQGEQWEAGVKGEYLGGLLTTSFALFQVEEQNRAVEGDPNVYTAEGKARSRGLETDVSGRLTPGWTMNANYTYTHKTYLDSSESDANLYESFLPKHILRVWTQYQLPGAWHKWQLSLGMNAVSKTTNKFAILDDAELEQSGYTLFDVGVGYRITPKVSADLLVTNLTDKKYYQRIHTPLDGNIFGDPRAATLTVRASF